MSEDPLSGMSEAEVQQLGADRTRMFVYISLIDAIPLLALFAALANIINYGITIALFLVASVVVWFTITATINKMPESAPAALRRPIQMLRVAFSGGLLLTAVVVWFIFQNPTN
jgi:hypothetical protein